MTSNYRQGRNYEIEIADLFRREGYEITLATNSKGMWDVVATKVERGIVHHVYYCTLMQCKTRKSRAKEVKE